MLRKVNLRRFALFLIDAVTIFIGSLLSIQILAELTDIRINLLDSMPVICLFMVLSLLFMAFLKVYMNIWRYAQVKDFFRCFIAMTAACFLTGIVLLIMKVSYSTIFLSMLYLLSISGVVVLRTGYNWLYGFFTSFENKNDGLNTLIVGAGAAGHRIVAEMQESKCGYNPVCIVDDDVAKYMSIVRGVTVMGTVKDIPELCKKYSIKVILIAIPSCQGEDKKRILDVCSKTSCEVKQLPYIHEVIDADSLMAQAQNIKIEDLLGRDVIKFDNTQVKNLVSGRVCMVTGGGGSIGSELSRQIAKYSPKQLIIVDIYENNAYNIQQELIREYGEKLDLHIEIASVRDYVKMDMIFSTYNPQLVFHAAAHKHVPLMETNPEEAIKNNVIGTFNVATLADFYRVERFVLISTDKAVNPTNVMGATKRSCEMIVQYMAQNSRHSKFITVRFGNVLGSNGSVIPLFENQLKSGGPLTVTHPDIIRYFMTIPEAVSLILQAASNADGGEIFVLDMGEPVKIVTLAENLIKLHGKEPYVDVKIEFTGLRPGEKLYEELLMDEEGLSRTENKKIFIGQQIDVDGDKLVGMLEKMKRMAEINDKEAVVDLLKQLVPTFNHKP